MSVYPADVVAAADVLVQVPGATSYQGVSRPAVHSAATAPLTTLVTAVMY